MTTSYHSPVVRGIQSFLQDHAEFSINHIVFMADISGGITDEQTDQAGLEMNCVMQAFRVHCTLIDFDDRVREMRVFMPGEHIFPEESGCGGTDYRPPFEYMNRNLPAPSLVICLTDGQCNRFAPAPAFPVFWCMLDNTPFEPPYGTVIRIYGDEEADSLPKPPRENTNVDNPLLKHLSPYMQDPMFNEWLPIVTVVDISRSILQHHLVCAHRQIMEIIDTYRTGLTIVYADDDIRGARLYYPGDNIPIVRSSDQDSDYRSPFHFLNGLKPLPKIALYFTDGRCTKFPPTPSFPVLWCLFSEMPFDPPFGEVLRLPAK